MWGYQTPLLVPWSPLLGGIHLSLLLSFWVPASGLVLLGTSFDSTVPSHPSRRWETWPLKFLGSRAADWPPPALQSLLSSFPALGIPLCPPALKPLSRLLGTCRSAGPHGGQVLHPLKVGRHLVGRHRRDERHFWNLCPATRALAWVV